MKFIDKEEKDLIQSYDRGEWKPIKKKNQKAYIDAARKSISKNKRINIRLTAKDFHDIQVKALEEGIHYQTLISSLIHKYNNGTVEYMTRKRRRSNYGKLKSSAK